MPNSREFLNILIDHVPAAVAFFDRDMCYIAASRRWFEDYGLRDRDILGHSHYAIFPEMPEHWKDAHRRALEGQVQEMQEDAFERADGSVQWLHWIVRPWYGNDGSIGGLVVLSEDISARKAARDQKKLWGELFEKAAFGLAITDAATNRFLAVNPAYAEVHGYAQDELVGQELSAVYPDRGMTEDILSRLKQTPYLEFDTVHVTKDGRRFPVHMEITELFSDDGRPDKRIHYAVDISERKAAQDRLRLWGEMFEKSAFGLAMADAATNTFITVNPAFAADHGYSPEDLVGQSLMSMFPPERADEVRKNIAILDKQRHLVFESEHLRKDGSRFPVLLDVTTIDSADGEPMNRIAYVLDISDRKRDEEKLREQDELFREMSHLAHVGGWAFDPESGDGTWTEEVARIHGVHAETATSASFGLDFYREESRDRIEKAVKAASELGTPYDLELELITATGQHKWVRTICNPIVDDGKVSKVRGSIQDITGRKQTEKQLAHLNNVLDGIRKVNQIIIRETDPRLLIQRSCEALAHTRGFTTVAIALTDGSVPVISAHAMAGRGMESLQNMLGQGCIPGCATEAIATNAVVARNFEDTACDGCPVAPERRDGTDELTIAIRHATRLYGFILVCMPSGMGANQEEAHLLQEIADDIGFALHAFHDRAERDKATASLAATEDQLRQAQKLESIGRLAGGVAHDFNNILAAQMAFCELIGMHPDDVDQVQEKVDKIRDCAERAASLTRQLLAFSRKQTLQPRVLDLNAEVIQVEKMLRRLIGEDIALHTSLAGDLGRVKVDPGQIEQVIMNLVVNARDAMPRGGRLSIETANVAFDEIYVRTHAGAQHGPHVMLAVSDNGEGMDAETQRQIFEPFFTTKAVGKGTGLGLSTVYGIVKQSGGNILVYSEPGRGTTFKIYLPRVDEDLTTRPEQVPLHADGQGESILVVEDDATLREVFVDLIGKMGYRVHAAGNASEALEAVAGGLKPDLLLTDVVMPGTSGRVLGELLVEMQPGLKVIYTSGYTGDAVVHHGLIDEETEFLQKPFTSAELARKLRMVLGD